VYHCFNNRHEDGRLFDLPAKKEGEPWEYKADNILLVKDSALAALNSVQKTWSEASITHARQPHFD
jgi:hypothetical protein